MTTNNDAPIIRSSVGAPLVAPQVPGRCAARGEPDRSVVVSVAAVGAFSPERRPPIYGLKPFCLHTLMLALFVGPVMATDSRWHGMPREGTVVYTTAHNQVMRRDRMNDNADMGIVLLGLSGILGLIETAMGLGIALALVALYVLTCIRVLAEYETAGRIAEHSVRHCQLPHPAHWAE